jgi:hypothetical protein
MRALFVLTPAESKRLIAKAVAEMEEVKRAKKKRENTHRPWLDERLCSGRDSGEGKSI